MASYRVTGNCVAMGEAAGKAAAWAAQAFPSFAPLLREAADAYEQGGYESRTSDFGPSVAADIVRAMTELLHTR